MSLRCADTSLHDLLGRLSLHHTVSASAIQNSFLKLLVFTSTKEFIVFFEIVAKKLIKDQKY